jgi:hypothetical protein
MSHPEHAPGLFLCLAALAFFVIARNNAHISIVDLFYVRLTNPHIPT